MHGLVVLLLSLPVQAQPAPDQLVQDDQALACPIVDIPVQVTGRPLLLAGSRAGLVVRTPLCGGESAPPPPPADILHGAAPGSDLLRGDGPADLLGNTRRERVIVTRP